MTRADANRILNNLEAVRHFAKGGALEYHYSDCNGNDWWDLSTDNRMLIAHLDNYRPVEGCLCTKCPFQPCDKARHRQCKSKARRKKK
jgi:hypothetical protein